MTELEKSLINRFGSSNVISIDCNEDQIPLLHIKMDQKSSVSILVTNGLSNYTMLVPDAEKGREHNELYFCLPSYWDIKDLNNPNMNWVHYWIQRLVKYVLDKKTWLGPGHTMACGNPFQNLSDINRCNHFILNNPMLLKEELIPITIDGKTIYFLAIIPMFEDEMDFKQGKGTQKLIKKFESNNVTEKIDDYRCTVLRSKWRFVK